MKVCGGCNHEYDEQFRFCPMCGSEFGKARNPGVETDLNKNLMEMKRLANQEALLSKRVFSGGGLGADKIGRTYGSDTDV